MQQRKGGRTVKDVFSKVNGKELEKLLEKVGWEDVWNEIRLDLGDGKIKKEIRDELILQLIRRRDVSLEEIGACFGITRAAVSLIAKEAGVEVVRASTYQQAWDRVAELKRAKGRQEAARVLRLAAKDPRFWVDRIDGQRGKLRKSLVLEELGFPPTLQAVYVTECWKELVKAGVIAEETLPGVVLRYGHGIENPRDWLEEQYHRRSETTLQDITNQINQVSQRKGLLEISQRSLQYYMEKHKIKSKPQGSRKPRRLS